MAGDSISNKGTQRALIGAGIAAATAGAMATAFLWNASATGCMTTT